MVKINNPKGGVHVLSEDQEDRQQYSPFIQSLEAIRADLKKKKLDLPALKADILAVQVVAQQQPELNTTGVNLEEMIAGLFRELHVRNSAFLIESPAGYGDYLVEGATWPQDSLLRNRMPPMITPVVRFDSCPSRRAPIQDVRGTKPTRRQLMQFALLFRKILRKDPVHGATKDNNGVSCVRPIHADHPTFTWQDAFPYLFYDRTRWPGCPTCDLHASLLLGVLCCEMRIDGVGGVGIRASDPPRLLPTVAATRNLQIEDWYRIICAHYRFSYRTNVTHREAHVEAVFDWERDWAKKDKEIMELWSWAAASAKPQHGLLTPDWGRLTLPEYQPGGH